jgi:hypothetical protein
MKSEESEESQVQESVETQALPTVNNLVGTLAKLGISKMPSMNDIVEMVAAEKFKEYKYKLTTLNKAARELSDRLTQEYNVIKYNKILKVIYKKGFPTKTVFELDCAKHWSGGKIVRSVFVIADNSNQSVIVLTCSNDSGTAKVGENISFRVSIKLPSTNIILEFTQPIDVSILESELPQDLLTEIEEHNVKVTEFVEEFNNLSLSKMKAAIKSEFQRQSMVTLPNEVVNLLENTFNINIKPNQE